MSEGKSLNKFISETGICSRREADGFIDEGRVKLNGQVARKGNRVMENDVVTLDDQPVENKTTPVYIALNKEPGVTCTTDRTDPDNIVDYMDYPQRIFPIGRIDKSSSGLILLTNDGDIVNKILREEHNHDKEYIVTVDRSITHTFLQRMAEGIPILGTKTKQCEIVKMADKTFKIILTQGLNRQIRRMCEFLGFEVQTLKRVRIMNIVLGELEVGEWRDLNEEELTTLRRKLDH